MPLIFLVEPESRYVERVRDALEREGWQLETFDDKDRALQRAAAAGPNLVIINLEVESAEVALKTFARKSGGPGVLALIAERRAGEAGSLAVHADAYLIKPFTDSDLRQTVKRLAATAHGAGPAAPAAASAAPASAASEQKLTSQDLFGDLLAEFSDAGDEPKPASAASAQAKAEAEIQRKLEETLSGVLGSGPRRPPTSPLAPLAPAALAPAPATPAAPEAPPAQPTVRRPRTQSIEVEDLLSRTLSELDLGKPKTSIKPPAAVPPPAAPAPAAPAPPAPVSPPPGELLSPVPTLEMPRLSGERIDSGASTIEMPRLDRPLEVPAATLEMKLPRLEELAPRVPDVPPAPAPAAAPVVPPAAPLAGPPLSAATQRIPVFSGELAAGQLFGQYSLIEKIAIGGMAEVWKARMRGVEGFEKTVAIKRILPHLTDNSAFLSMFIDEAKLAAQLNHPNITHIYDLGKIGEVYYIAMEFVEGRNLRALLSAVRRRGLRLPVGLALLIASRLASALDYAHRKKDFDGHDLGLVHRDVSPQNVLLSYEGDIKLCDFGIVKAVSKASHTQMGALKGKLQYMSPEQAWGRAVDGRSDLFSLGALLFEMLTGRRLFPGDNEIAVLDAVREGRVESPRDVEPAVPVEVDDVVRKALARDPAARYSSASEMQAALDSVLYNLRPAPSQADLAAFLRQLFLEPAPSTESGASETTPSPLRRLTDLAVESKAPPRPTAAAPAPAASRPSPAAPSPKLEPELPKSAPGVQVIAPPKGESVDLGEVGGGKKNRGFKLLVAALLLIALVIAVWNMMTRLGGDGSAAPDAEAGEESAPRGEPAQEAPQAPATAPGETSEGATPPATDRAESSSSPTPTLEQRVDAAVAKNTDEARRKLQEQERELARQLAAKNAEQQKVAAEQQAAEEARLREAELATQQQAEQERTEREARERQEAERRQREQEESERRVAEERAQQEKAATEAARTQPGQLVTLGPGVTPPRLVSRSEPEYPPVARRLRAEGEVEVSVLVDENGAVAEAKVVRTTREGVGFDSEALRVARAAKFSPATKDGVRVKVWYKIRIPFRLKE